MTENTIGATLAAMRERAGMTLAEIAASAGYRGPSSVQMMFSPDYSVPALSWSVANKLARALVGKGNPPISLSEIHRLCYTDEQWMPKEPRASNDLAHGYSERFRTSPDAPSVPTPRTRDIPVFGTALAADLEFDDVGTGQLVEQTVFEMGEVIAYARRPAGIYPEADAYALYVSGSSMEPRYRPGDPIFVDAKRPPAIGDDVIVQLNAQVDGEPEIVAGLIKTLVRRTGSYLELEQYHPELRFRVPMSRVTRLHRVVPTKELFGI